MDVFAEARGATMRFGQFAAVSKVDLTVGHGEILGLLGANGAGKTTLIRMLVGLLRPSGGSIRLFGAAPSLQARRRVGYVPQTLGLYGGLTVAENWSFTAAAFRNTGVPLPEGISGWHKQLAGELPLGAQRQVAFAIALAHRPEFLVLDEPTSGVGPLGSARLWEGIRAAADQGAGVLVTTHNLEEAEQCDRLVIMTDGAVVAKGTSDDITAGLKVCEVSANDWARAFALLDAARLPVESHGTTLRVGATPEAVRDALAPSSISFTIDEVPANLEEAFVAIYARKARS